MLLLRWLWYRLGVDRESVFPSGLLELVMVRLLNDLPSLRDGVRRSAEQRSNAPTKLYHHAIQFVCVADGTGLSSRCSSGSARPAVTALWAGSAHPPRPTITQLLRNHILFFATAFYSAYAGVLFFFYGLEVQLPPLVQASPSPQVQRRPLQAQRSRRVRLPATRSANRAGKISD